MSKTHSDVLSAELWMPLAELARAKGVSRQAVTRRVNRLVALGLIETRPGERGERLVHLAAYDRAVGQTEDAVRTLNGTQATAVLPCDPVLAKEQARRAAYDADLKKLDLDERLAALLPMAEVTEAMAQCSSVMVLVFDRLADHADDMAHVVATHGVAGARSFLKTLSRHMRGDVAKALVEAINLSATSRPPS